MSTTEAGGYRQNSSQRVPTFSNPDRRRFVPCEEGGRPAVGKTNLRKSRFFGFRSARRMRKLQRFASCCSTALSSLSFFRFGSVQCVVTCPTRTRWVFLPAHCFSYSFATSLRLTLHFYSVVQTNRAFSSASRSESPRKSSCHCRGSSASSTSIFAISPWTSTSRNSKPNVSPAIF